MESETVKKSNIFKRIGTWLAGIFVILAVLVSILSMTVVNKTKSNGIIGYQMYIVLSDSMKDTFEAGDIIFTKKVDAGTLKEGDIITFISTNDESYGKIVTHKIREVETKGSQISFVTYGTTTNEDDQKSVLEKNVIGKYHGKISKVGYFFEFLKTPLGYSLILLLPLGVLLVLQGADVLKLFKKYKLEKSEEISLENTKKDEMQDEIKRLKDELDALKGKKE